MLFFKNYRKQYSKAPVNTLKYFGEFGSARLCGMRTAESKRPAPFPRPTRTRGGWPYRPRGFPIANGPGPVIGRGVQPDPNGPGVRASGAREPTNPSAEIAVTPNRRTARCGPTEAQTGPVLRNRRRSRGVFKIPASGGGPASQIHPCRPRQWPYCPTRWAFVWDVV